MRYAAGLTMIGAGGLLVYAGFTKRSVWLILREGFVSGTFTPSASPATSLGGTIKQPPGDPGYTSTDGTPLPSLPWNDGQPV